MKTLTQLLRLRQTCCDPAFSKKASPPINRPSSMPFANSFTPAWKETTACSSFPNSCKSFNFSKRSSKPPPALLLPRRILQGPHGSSRPLPGRRIRPRVPDLAQGRRNRTELDRSGRRRALRPLVEPRRRGSSQRPSPPHRSGQTSHRLQADHLGNGGGTSARPQQGKRKLLEQVFEESEAANLSLGVEDLRELI